jgi:hypothetical protein
MTSIFRFISISAVAALIMSALPAFAGGVHFYVPVKLDNLPPEMRAGTVSCYVAEHDIFAARGMTDFRITGRVYYATVDVVMRHSELMATPSPASTYVCRLYLLGESYTTELSWSPNYGVTTDGWVDDSHYGRILTRAPGSVMQLTVGGPLPEAVARELAEVGDCPCGCGGNSANGTSACSPAGARPTFVFPGQLAPAAPNSNSLSKPPTPAGVAGLFAGAGILTVGPRPAPFLRTTDLTFTATGTLGHHAP